MSDPHWVGNPAETLREVLEVDRSVREELADIFNRAAMQLGTADTVRCEALLLAECILLHGQTLPPGASVSWKTARKP